MVPNLSAEVADYTRYVRSLGFEDAPDYDRLRAYFHSILAANAWPCDWAFDWTTRPANQSAAAVEPGRGEMTVQYSRSASGAVNHALVVTPPDAPAEGRMGGEPGGLGGTGGPGGTTNRVRVCA